MLAWLVTLLMRTATPQISVLFKQQKASKNRNLHQAFWVDFFNNFDKGNYHGNNNILYKEIKSLSQSSIFWCNTCFYLLQRNCHKFIFAIITQVEFKQCFNQSTLVKMGYVTYVTVVTAVVNTVFRQCDTCYKYFHFC